VSARATVVVVNWNGAHLLPACLDALAKQDVDDFETWVADNASADGSVELLRRDYPWVRVIETGGNLGFAGGNNAALREVTTPYAVLLNNDAVPEPSWLRNTLAAFDDGIGAVTPKIVFLPRFVRLTLATTGFSPGPADTRDLGVRVHRVTVDGEDVRPLWERLTYGDEGGFSWTRPTGDLLLPAGREVTFAWAAEREKDVRLSWDGGEVTLTATGDVTEATFTLPAGIATFDVVNNAGGIVTRTGYGADRGFQEVDEGQYDKPEDVFTFCGNGAAFPREVLGEGRALRRRLLPLLRGHRSLVARARGGLGDPLRAHRGPAPPPLREQRRGDVRLPLPRRSQPPADAHQERVVAARAAAGLSLPADHRVDRVARGPHPQPRDARRHQAPPARHRVVPAAAAAHARAPPPHRRDAPGVPPRPRTVAGRAALRLGMDATPLLGQRSGIGTYVAGLLSGLAELAAPPEVVLTSFTWRGVDGLPSGYERAPRRFSARALQELWLRADWPPVEWLSGRVDVFHGTNFVLPPTRRAAGVLSIHDLTYEHHADTVAPATLRYRTLVPRALKRGAYVLTLTETVAAEVREHYGTDRVGVATPGVAPEWFDDPGPRPDGLPDEYVLFVGNREPRKNLPVLLDAMARLGPNAPPLVLAGPPGWGPALDMANVVAPGYLSGDALRAAVAHARLLAFPSRYEGFGLPPVEAFATGTPVVASDLPVLREVLGGHATYATTGDADALADAIRATLDTGSPTSAEARRAHAATYTWRRCAEEAMAGYERALR
jgi:glycosyltransferase involved in cell wall biosynthesis